MYFLLRYFRMFNFFKMIFVDVKVPKANKRPMATFYGTTSADGHIPFRISWCRKKPKRSRDKVLNEFESDIRSSYRSYGAYTA